MDEEKILQIEEKIENYIEEHIRPMLAMDGGDLEFLHFDPDDGIVYVRFLGHCFTCPFRQMTLEMSIKTPLIENIEEVKEVKLVEGDIKITEINNLEEGEKNNNEEKESELKNSEDNSQQEENLNDN